MPVFKKLSREQVGELKPKRDQPKDDILAPYIAEVEKIEPGEGIEIDLTPEDNPRAVKRRLTIAAKSLGKQLKYRDGSENKIVAEILAKNSSK